MPPSTKLTAKAVVAGGGVMGLSVAYNLAKRGASVLLFEKDCVGSHSETHPTNVGLVTAPYFWPDAMAQRMARKSLKLYSDLAKVAGFRFARCGRVYMAASDEAELHVRRIHSRSLVKGEANELLDCPSEMLARWPMLNTEDLRVALHSVEDISLDNMGLCSALADAAREHGAQVYENCAVKKVMVGDGMRIFAVDTEEGLVETDVFVNAAGIHSSMIPVTSLPERCVRVPAWPCTYTMLTAERLPASNLHDSTPAFVDMDNSTFIYANDSRTICGGFVESEVTALKMPHGLQAEWQLPHPDWSMFHPVLKSLIYRCPSLANVVSGDLTAGCEMYSPDMYPAIGETDQVRGYFVANGLNGQGLAMAGGLGEILAQWITDGVTSLDRDISKFDVTRFSRQHTNPQYLYERAPEIASNTFKPLHYSHQCHTARNLRMSPVYHHLRSNGAVFGEVMGYERPLWFCPDIETTQIYCGQDSNMGTPHWFRPVKKEYEACRERVGLIDMSSFSKFDIQGPDVVDFLQRVCSANIDKPIGTTIYTGMQNERGGYVTDCTLSRIAPQQFFMVAPSVQQIRCPLWLNKWISEWRMNVHVQDVTGLYTALDVVGPASRYLMQDITGIEMSSSGFPSFTCRDISIGMAAGIRAISVTHCGELGWMLYIPNEVAQNVYEQIVDAGEEYSMLNAGYYALRHLRIEKFYVYWGHDINATVTPAECGRLFRVDFDKEFIGREALLAQKDNGDFVKKRFVQLLVDGHNIEVDPWPQGDEPIYRDGKVCGWTTSAAYGFTLGTQVCIGYLRSPTGVTQDFVNQGKFEVDIAGKRFPLRINFHSPSLPMVSSEHPTHYRPTQ